jgi:hypothetical protein
MRCVLPYSAENLSALRDNRIFQVMYHMGSAPYRMLMVGNKLDLADQRQVSYEEALNLAYVFFFIYFLLPFLTSQKPLLVLGPAIL